jgi:hypothetical protein
MCSNDRAFLKKRIPLALALFFASLALAQTPDLRSIHKIYIDKLPNDLDQYLRLSSSSR